MGSDFQSIVGVILAQYRASVVDGKLTFREVMTLVYNAVVTFVRLAEKLETGEKAGESKKQVVTAAIIRLYDEVVAPVDIKAIPNFMEPLVDAAIRSLILTLAESMLESAVKLFNQLGWGTDTEAVTMASGELPAGVHVIGL